MTPLFIRDEAQADLTEAFIWYEDRSPGLGYEFLRNVRVVLAQIERTPLMFPELFSGVRRATIRRFPYGIFFAPESDASVVLAVYHLRRDPRGWHRRI